MLLFNTTLVYADISGTLPTPFPTPLPLPPDPAEFLIRLCLPDGGEALDYVSDWLKKRWSTDGDKSKDMSTDGNTVTFNSNFVNQFNTTLQNKVHALDGYYLIEPRGDLKTWAKSFSSKSSSDELELYNCILEDPTYVPTTTGGFFPILTTRLYFIAGDRLKKGDIIDSSPYLTNIQEPNFLMEGHGLKFYSGNVFASDATYYSKSSYGAPFKLFYSKMDALLYLNNGRT